MVVRVEAAGSVRPVAATGLLTEGNVQAWRSGARFVGGRHGGHLYAYERDRLLAGDPAPAWEVPLPTIQGLGSRPRFAEATVEPGGGFAVCAGTTEVWALEESGQVRWTLPHDTWRDAPPGAPSVSPDGRYVSVLVPMRHESLADPAAERPYVQAGIGAPGDGGHYVSDRWLLLDAATGNPLRRQVFPLAAEEVTHRWHLDEARVAVSAFMSWYGWRTAWFSLGDESDLAGRDSRWLADIHPGGKPVYSVRNYQSDTGDFVENSVTADGHGGTELARVHAGDLGLDEEEDDLVNAVVVAPDRLLCAFWSGVNRPVRHWLLDAGTLRAVGEVGYPRPVGTGLGPLGDGTWLTTDGAELTRWRVSR